MREGIEMDNVTALRMVNICKHVQVSLNLIFLFNEKVLIFFFNFLDQSTNVTRMLKRTYTRSKRKFTKITIICLKKNH